MELRRLTADELRAFYNAYLTSSFPADELKPLRIMERLLPTGRYHAWGLDDGGKVAALATVYHLEPGWALFDYLCVAPERRGQGLGSRIISELLRAEGECVLFGESESPRYAPDPDLARRRLGFYHRTGARDAGYEAALLGVVYRVLYWAGREISADEIMVRHQTLWRRRFSGKLFEKYVTIPWTEADGMPAQLNWADLKGEADD